MGIGAVVALTAEIGGAVVTQTHPISSQTGGGTSSQNSLTAHFGLGDATLVQEVTVSWPSGIVDTYLNLAVDQRLAALEGAGTADVSELAAAGGQLDLRTSPSVIRSAAELAFDLPDADQVRLGIYDAQGRLIETLLARPLSAGHHRVVWTPRETGTGTCFCRLRAGSRQEALRLIVLKKSLPHWPGG